MPLPVDVKEDAKTVDETESSVAGHHPRGETEALHLEKKEEEGPGKKTVRFSATSKGGSDDGSIRGGYQSIRSIESERGDSFHRTEEGAIHLSRSEAPATTCSAGMRSYVNGDFASGKTRDLITERGCHTMAFHPEPSSQLLAVGLKDGLAFYETTQYTMVHKEASRDMVSALQWLPLPGKRDSSLLATGYLDGLVVLYKIDSRILEIQGPTVVHQFYVQGQVRTIDCSFFGKLDASVVLAAGDKTGSITLSSYTRDLDNICTDVVVDQPSGGVLALAILPTRGYIAWSTKAGEVCVHQLRRDSSGAVRLDRQLFCMQRNGPVRCVVFSKDGSKLALGGYDKTVVLVDTELWAVFRELEVQGTINTITFDPKERYLAVGSRDKSLRIFDTSTLVNIKTFHTPGWVTSVSWGPMRSSDIVAVRTEKTCISILDLAPISTSDIRMSSRHGTLSSVSWTRNGRYIARTRGTSVVVADCISGFRDVACCDLQGDVIKVVFSTAPDNHNLLAAIDEAGYLTLFQLQTDTQKASLVQVNSVMVEVNLKSLAWSPDGSSLATGGRERRLHFISAKNLKPLRKPVDMDARVWDVDFCPAANATYFVAVALGNYNAVILNESFEPCLQIVRSRTVRCLQCHPTLSLLAVGDGAGLVAIIDYQAEDLLTDIDVGARVNAVEFSKMGDYLLVGTDACMFSFYETSSYQCLQVIRSSGFALATAFSPTGAYLGLGSASESYCLVNLGLFLSLDLIPLNIEGGVEKLPSWARNEALFRSGYGPSFIQRNMIEGGSDSLRRGAAVLREHPDVIYAFNRKTNESCFDTALNLKRPNLLKMAMISLVDGTLDNTNDGQKSILTTDIPFKGREALMDFAENCPPEFIISILNAMTLAKVPFAKPHVVNSSRRLECASPSYMEPWDAKTQSHGDMKLFYQTEESTQGTPALTPAVLPVPGLGDMDFLTSLLSNVPPSVFDNEAMGLVLRVMWRDHIRKYFYVEALIFLAYYICWAVLLELMVSSSTFSVSVGDKTAESSISFIVMALNSGFLSKEIIQSRFGNQKHYFLSLWNAVDLLSILCVYGYIVTAFAAQVAGYKMVPLAVITTLLLTVKLLSYLRGFRDTGWLISVLIANFRDVRGFLIILFAILVGFTIAFRLLFANTGDPGFESLRRAFLSTFEMTILGSYDTSLLYDSRFRVLAALTFILAVTCVLVVALNALISILADSYARVQENATANRRREQAALIVEYLALLPPWRRLKIERDTQWFHTLLEVDAEGELVQQNDDWEGGLNSLRRDMEEMSEANQQSQQKMIEQVKADLNSELSSFKKEVVELLEDLSQDVKRLHAIHSEGGVTFSGKNVAKAVKAVKSIHKRGTAMLRAKDSVDGH